MPGDERLEVQDHFLACARLLGIEVVETTDAFGRAGYAIEPGGLHKMLAVARSRGHLEVAAHIEQLIDSAVPIDGRPSG